MSAGRRARAALLACGILGVAVIAPVAANADPSSKAVMRAVKKQVRVEARGAVGQYWRHPGACFIYEEYAVCATGFDGVPLASSGGYMHCRYDVVVRGHPLVATRTDTTRCWRSYKRRPGS